MLVRTPGDEGVMTRLRAELATARWRLLEIRLDERQPRLPLATIAEHERASAAVRFDERSGAIDLWVTRAGGALQESLATPGVPARERVLALRAAEALRAHGLALDPLEAPAERAEAPATKAAAAPPRATFDQGRSPSPRGRALASRLWLGLGPGVVSSPGGLAPLIVGMPEARLELQRWSFSALALLPLTRAEVEGLEGSARIAPWVFGGAIDFDWVSRPALNVRSGVGAGASAATMSGEAASGYRGVDESVYVATFFLRSSLAFELGRSFRLGPSMLVGATQPRVRVAFGAREAAHWGVPFAVFGLALEACALRSE